MIYNSYRTWGLPSQEQVQVQLENPGAVKVFLGLEIIVRRQVHQSIQVALRHLWSQSVNVIAIAIVTNCVTNSSI